MLHNVVRCMHDVKFNKWSESVAANLDTHLKLGGKPVEPTNLKPPAGPAAESIFEGSAPGDAVRTWYGESTTPGCGSPGFPGCGPDGPAAGTGHFTAMVWAGAETLGCASHDGKVIGCRYKGGDELTTNTPNTEGGYTANVFAPKREFAECKSEVETCFGIAQGSLELSLPSPTGSTET